MPETAFVKVLEALEIANPSIVTEALAPVTVWVNPSPLELTEKFQGIFNACDNFEVFINVSLKFSFN